MEWIRGLGNGLGRWFDGDFSSSAAPRIVEKIGEGVVALGLLLVSYFLAKLVSRYIAGGICRRVDETLGKFVGRLSFYTVIVASSLGILANFGVPVAGAMAVLTAAGFAIGLAFQGTLSNFASGVLLLVFRPFKVGDMIVAGGAMGKVNEIDLFTTTLDTPDNRRLIIPNSAIAGGTIENMTYHAHRRVDVVIGVSYRAGLEQTRAALTAAVGAVSDLVVEGDNRGYQIMLTQLAASSVEWTVRFWTPKQNVFAARERLIQEIKVQLDRAGIEIPFPQMQVHLSPSSGAAVAPENGEYSANVPVRPRMRRTGSEAA